MLGGVQLRRQGARSSRRMGELAASLRGLWRLDRAQAGRRPVVLARMQVRVECRCQGEL